MARVGKSRLDVLRGRIEQLESRRVERALEVLGPYLRVLDDDDREVVFREGDERGAAVRSALETAAREGQTPAQLERSLYPEFVAERERREAEAEAERVRHRIAHFRERAEKGEAGLWELNFLREHGVEVEPKREPVDAVAFMASAGVPGQVLVGGEPVREPPKPEEQPAQRGFVTLRYVGYQTGFTVRDRTGKDITVQRDVEVEVENDRLDNFRMNVYDERGRVESQALRDWEIIGG